MIKDKIKFIPYATIGLTTGLIFRRIVDSYILGAIYALISTLILSMVIFALSKKLNNRREE